MKKNSGSRNGTKTRLKGKKERLTYTAETSFWTGQTNCEERKKIDGEDRRARWNPIWRRAGVSTWAKVGSGEVIIEREKRR